MKEENKRVKKCMCQSKKDVNEQLGRKMNQNVSENKRKRISSFVEKMKSFGRVKDRTERLAVR